MTTLLLLVALTTATPAQKPAAPQAPAVTPLQPGEWREIGGPIEGNSVGSYRWGCFGERSYRGAYGRGAAYGRGGFARGGRGRR